MSAPDQNNGYDEGDDRLLAAEFVLGLVEGNRRDVLARRAASDPAFAALVADWEGRLGGLADEVVPVDAPPHVWDGIANKLASVSATSGPAREPAPGLWNSLPFWRGLSFTMSGLAAAGLAALVLLPGARPLPMPPMVAVLKLEDGRSAFMAAVDRNTGQLMLMPAVPGDAPPEHVHELWLVLSDGAARSLGTFAASGPIKMPMPADVMPRTGAAPSLAISVEPMGGSPTGQPTGPVVARGEMSGI
jgi:anti-sigma-K factor RskA